MPNYQQSDVAGTKYTRAYQVNIKNGIDDKSITFYEEELINLDSNESITKKLGEISEIFTTENASSSFPMLNPETGEEIQAGATMTYSGVYTALYSLYIHLATQRDAG